MSDEYIKKLEERTRIAEEKYYLEYDMRQLAEDRFDLLLERTEQHAENIRAHAEDILDQIYDNELSPGGVHVAQTCSKYIIELTEGLIEDTKKVINSEVTKECQKKKHT